MFKLLTDAYFDIFDCCLLTFQVIFHLTFKLDQIRSM